MDLQAILDASDSDDESQVTNADLERILREDEVTEESGEARNDAATMSASTISTATFLKRHDQHAYPKFTTGSHNAEDWAVLQQILGEDDDTEEWVDTTVTNHLRQQWKTMDVDAILNSIQSDEDEDFITDKREPMTSKPNNGTNLWDLPAEHSADTPVMTGSRGIYVDSKSPIPHNIIQPDIISPLGASKSLDFSNDNDEARLQGALSRAQAYEKRLLQPGHRDIVSPLMVKRRLKPRMELNTQMQQRQRQQNPHEKTKLTSSQVPRFGFSTIVESKTMPSLSANLQKNVHSAEVGLPSALAVNSKFIAIGTQRSIILVFDLFEVLRHQLGRPTPEGGAPASEGGQCNASQFGAITSLDISGNGEALLAGYTSGFLVLWDIIKGVMIKTVTEVHQSPITTVRFLTDKELKVVTVDAGGLVNKLTFSKNILWSAYSMDVECLLDGTAGQILATDVLPQLVLKPTKAGTPKPSIPPALHKLVLIALSSERSSFAVAVEPSISVLHRWSKPPDELVQPKNSELNLPTGQNYLPCLAWGWSLVSGGGGAVSPILARSWGCSLQLLRASFLTSENGGSEGFHWPAFGIHDEFIVPSPVVALEWLGERSLVYLTVTNEFTVIDTVMMTLLERLDFSGLRLIYAEFSLSRGFTKHESVTEMHIDQFKGLPSPMCTTFQNSFRCSDDRVLVLCQEEVKSVSILNAKRRISALEEDGEWLEALALALDHYENTIKSQDDRKRNPEGMKDLAKHPEFCGSQICDDEDWIAKLLVRYLNLAVDNAPEAASRTSISRLDLAQSHFQMLAGVCLEFCVVIRRLDLLFGPIFRRFHSVGYTSVFFDVMEPYVLNDKLEYIAPEVMAHFVEHCKTTNDIATVECCLLHMNVTIMDFDTIISLLRKNEMYSALFHVFTHGLNDFVTPLEIILERIFDAADEANTENRLHTHGGKPIINAYERFGYKAIIYLQHIFRGNSFPQDTALLPENKLLTVRPQLLQFLQQERYEPSVDLKSVKDAAIKPVGYRTLSYPYTHILLMVDARAVLETFRLALDAPDEEFATSDSNFESIGGWEVEVGTDASDPSRRSARNGTNHHSQTPDRQHVVTMLSSIFFPDMKGDTLSTLSYSRSAGNAFLDFMSTYLIKGVVRANKSTTFLILSRLAELYENGATPDSRQPAQEQIIALLEALPRNAYDPADVLRMVELGGIHRVALILHQQGASAWHEGSDDEDRRAHHFRKAIDCYLEDEDPDFKLNVFEYAKKECTGSNTTEDSDATGLRSALSSKLTELVNLDAILAAQLVAELYIEDLDEVIISFDQSDRGIAQFMFLHAIVSGDLGKIDVVAGSVLSANLTMNHHQTYLGLMAKLHPNMVYQYLSTHDNYRAEECLRLCQRHDIADASAYLLEKMGNVSSALQLILQTLEGRMMSLKRTIRGMGPDVVKQPLLSRLIKSDWKTEELTHTAAQQERQENEVNGINQMLVVALDLCERNSGTSSPLSEHGSQLWFNVLDRLINAKGFLRLSKEHPAHAKIMAGVLGDLLQLTMQRMVSSVPLSDLVRKVTTDHAGSRLGELREMVESLLSTYGHELTVFTGAANVMQQDFQQMEVTNRRLKIEGSRVRSVMSYPLAQSYNAMGSGFAESYASSGLNLRLGYNGDATFSDGGQLLQKRYQSGGLVNALGRLRSRRINSAIPASTVDEPVQKKNKSSLSFLPVRDQLYLGGESSEAAYCGERVIGVLGEAECYGRIHFW